MQSSGPSPDMASKIAQTMAQTRALAAHQLKRLQPEQTIVSVDESGEVSYQAKRKDPKSVPFKPLQDMTMKMLKDAVNHSKLKSQIAEEVKSEKSDRQKKQRWQESSSEDLYSNCDEDEGSQKGYQLPDIDPEKLNIAAAEDKEELSD